MQPQNCPPNSCPLLLDVQGALVLPKELPQHHLIYLACTSGIYQDVAQHPSVLHICANRAYKSSTESSQST